MDSLSSEAKLHDLAGVAATRRERKRVLPKATLRWDGDNLAIGAVKNESRHIGCLQMLDEVSLTRSLSRKDCPGVRCLPRPPGRESESKQVLEAQLRATLEVVPGQPGTLIRLARSYLRERTDCELPVGGFGFFECELGRSSHRSGVVSRW